MNTDSLQVAADTVPLGPWAVGVSGGADSVALLSLLRGRADLRLHVVHLDHQTRGVESGADADFVRKLACSWGLPVTIARRDEWERRVHPLPANPSAKYRALRLALFRETVRINGLQGVILAHHADDQAETVLHRLLRGSGLAGLTGMEAQSVHGGLVVLRPLLGVRREALREHLMARRQNWREDASNGSDDYLRNRLRKLLCGDRSLTDALLTLSQAAQSMRQWVRKNAPALAGDFSADEVNCLPAPLARESARRWLMDRGAPREAIGPAVVDRLLVMAADAATPSRQHFPGQVQVTRQKKRLRAAERKPILPSG